MWLQGTPRPTWQISAWGHRKSKRHRSGNFLLAASTLATVCEAAGPELRAKGRILAKWMWSWASTSKAGVRHNLCLKTRVTLPTSLVVVHLLRWVIAVLLGKAELLSLGSCFQIQTAIKKWPSGRSFWPLQNQVILVGAQGSYRMELNIKLTSYLSDPFPCWQCGTNKHSLVPEPGPRDKWSFKT